MTTRQYLLMKLAEECAEVGQRAIKQAQFGKDEVQKNQLLTNAQRLRQELTDLAAVVVSLEKIGEIVKPSREELLAGIEAKIEKMRKYRAYSETLNQVKTDA
jgi:NTP pyrophosphatase (non-canonical NTP hydrolase)